MAQTSSGQSFDSPDSRLLPVSAYLGARLLPHEHVGLGIYITTVALETRLGCRLMTLLIVGGSGFLGTELVRQAVSAGHPTAATYTTRPGSAPGVTWRSLDLRDPGSAEAVVAEVNPRVIVNASSGGADWAVTAEGPVRLAIAAAKAGCRMIHVSSDAVFSGKSHVPYDEHCRPDPITPYGAAKAAAETVLLLHPDTAVARTSLIIGDGQSEHERTVHELATGTREGVLFTDDFRCPVHASDLAAALLELASGDTTGVHHLGGNRALSRHELGVLIARRDGLDASRLPTGLRADSALPGPLDIRLDTAQAAHHTAWCAPVPRAHGLNTAAGADDAADR